MAEANKHITYSLADIQRYLQGGMSAREMHNLERAALEDPFLADALEGYSKADMQQAQQHLEQIDIAIRQKHHKGKIVAFPALKKYHSWQIAASVILLVCIASITYFIFFNRANDVSLAKNESSETMLPSDSAKKPEQTLVFPYTDTAEVGNDEKPKAEKNNTAKLKNRKKRSDVSTQQSTTQSAAPMNDIEDDYTGAEIVRTSPRKDSRVPASEIAGTITDNHQQPIPNAKIRMQDSTQTITDKNGNFSISSSDSFTIANISAFGFKPLDSQKLRSGYNSIMLKEKQFRLSDVEVVNITTAGRRAVDTSTVMPQGGWQSFREYVYTRLQKKYDSTTVASIYVSGDLQLEFFINDAGEPVNFKVLRAPDAKIASEAISAIKAGPKWISKDKRSKLRIKVKY